MNKLIKLAKSFESKLVIKAESSDSQAFSKIIGNYEQMAEVLDVILEGLQLNMQVVEREVGQDQLNPEISNIIKEQNDLIESAIMSVYPKISELDAKLYDIYVKFD